MIGLYVPPGYKNLSPEAKKTICNGCGSAQSKFDFVPDKIWWLDISQACNIHDYMYFVAHPSLAEKHKADEAFLHNMMVLIESGTSNKIIKWLRRRAAKRYFEAVDYFGGPAFWEGK